MLAYKEFSLFLIKNILLTKTIIFKHWPKLCIF